MIRNVCEININHLILECTVMFSFTWRYQPAADKMKNLLENKADFSIKKNAAILKDFLSENPNTTLEQIKDFLGQKAGINALLRTTLYNRNNLSFEIIKYLVENKANLNDSKSEKRLSLACENKNINLEIIQYLVENKADLNLKNKEGKSVPDIMCEKKEIEMIKFFRFSDLKLPIEDIKKFSKEVQETLQKPLPDLYQEEGHKNFPLLPTETRQKITTFLICHSIFSKTHPPLKVPKPIQDIIIRNSI